MGSLSKEGLLFLCKYFLYYKYLLTQKETPIFDEN